MTAAPDPGAPARVQPALPPRSGQSLAQRFSIAIVMLVVAALVLALGTSYVATRHVLRRRVEGELRTAAALAANGIQASLMALVGDMEMLARNNLVATALVDSRDRALYVGPFLADYGALRRAYLVRVSLVDFTGALLATSHPGSRDYAGEAWVPGVIDDGNVYVGQLPERAGSLLLLAQPVIFPATGRAEGALVAEVDLRALFATRPSIGAPDLYVRLLGSGGAVIAGDPIVWAELATARHAVEGHPVLRTLGLQVELGTPARSFFRVFRWLALGYALGSVLLIAAALSTARSVAARLARPIQLLSAAAADIAAHGSYRGRVPVEGDDEIARLGTSFNDMLARLQAVSEAQYAEQVAHRRHAEATRDSIAAQLESLHRYANDSFLLVAPDGSIVEANDRALRSYGYTKEEMLRLDVRDIRAPAPLAQVEDEVARLLQSDEGSRFTTVHRRRDGTTFPVEVSTRPLELRGRRLLQSIVRDLTEERAARAAIEYQALLLDNMYDAVVGIDTAMAINAWNHAAERLFGWGSDEAIGKRFGEIVPSEYANGSSLEDMCREAAEGRLTFEVRRRTRGGEVVHLECTCVALRGPDGVLFGYVSVYRDVSLRRRAEAALRASQEQLRRILETVNEGIWVLDTRGRTQFVNARAAEMFGFEEGEAVGQSVIELVPPDLRPIVPGDLEALARGEAIQHELTLGRQGAPLFVVMSTSVLRETDGSIAGMVAAFMDVTAHRQTQERLLQSQKMEAVGRLASGVAHDFNNLLCVILSNANFLLEQLPGDDERRADAEGILEAGNRAARLVRQLLTFSRKEAPHAVPVTLESVVHGMEKLLRRTIGEDVIVSASFASEAWHTRINPGHLEQVLMNLAVNARDAMPRGGNLRIACRNEEIGSPPPRGCEGLPPGRYVLLEVSDTGSGMTPEIASRIFEPFFTTKERGKGTGLGLATVYGIVEQAKGRIAVQSEPGRGTTFTVYFPACEPGEAGSLTREAAPPVRGTGETVLVAEDEDAVRAVTRRMLERNGFRVVEARHVGEALSMLRRQRVDVILSDVVMPQGTGHDLAAQARELHSGIPVVLVSGYSDRQSAPEHGRILAKPFTEEALIERIHAALRAARAPARTSEQDPAPAIAAGTCTPACSQL